MSDRKAKYTPGPWVDRIDGKRSITRLDDFRIYYPNEDCLYEVARATAEWVDDEQERQANAAIIAAAPELFELGRAAMEDTCGGMTCDKCPSIDACNMARFIALLKRLESEITGE